MQPARSATAWRELAARLADGIDESWRIAKRGNDISNALARLDTVQAQTELAELRAQIGDGRAAMPQRSTASESRTIEALEAQVASAMRLQATVGRRPTRGCACSTPASTSSWLAAVEVSVGSGDTSVLGDDVDGLVTELESLRIALDETNAGRRAGADELPGTWPAT